jgi:hypothetical protein
MEYQERFEKALASDDPVEALRALALEFASSGAKRHEVFRRFLEFDSYLQDEGRDYHSVLVGDVMDMINQIYRPFNLNIPEDEG